MADQIALAAERHVLGTCMADPAAVEPVVALLRAGDFYDTRHETIFVHLVAAWASGEPTGPVALADRLAKAGELHRAGELPYLAELLAAALPAPMVIHHARIVAEHARLRAASADAARLAQAAQTGDLDQLAALQAGLAEAWARSPHGQPAGPTRFARTLLRRSELATLAPVEPLIEDVLSRRIAAVLFGATGIGKTVLAIGWACSVGTGTAWLGRPVHRCPVLYVVGEGAAGLHERVAAWEYAWGAKVEDTDVIFSVKPASLADPGTWAELTIEARTLGACLVILDTMSSLAPDADETKDAPAIIRRLSDLAVAIDGTALLIHHPGWSDDGRPRGGYQIEANADEVLKLAGNGTSDFVELTRKKVKDGVAGQAIPLRRKVITSAVDELGNAHRSVVIEAASKAEAAGPLRDQILAVLADRGEHGATARQLIDECDLDPKKASTLYKALRKLVAEKLVGKLGARTRERYWLAEWTEVDRGPLAESTPSGPRVDRNGSL